MTPTHAISADEARKLLAEDRASGNVFEWQGTDAQRQWVLERWGCLCSLAVNTPTRDCGPAGRHVDGCPRAP